MTERPAHFGCTKLVVADLDKASDFYKSVFGLIEQHRVLAKIEGRPVTEILFEATAPGAAIFVLMAYNDGAAPALSESINLFITPDLAGILEKARKAGGRIVQAASDMPEHGVKVAFLRDPEGHLLQVVQFL